MAENVDMGCVPTRKIKSVDDATNKIRGEVHPKVVEACSRGVNGNGQRADAVGQVRRIIGKYFEIHGLSPNVDLQQHVMSLVLKCLPKDGEELSKFYDTMGDLAIARSTRLARELVQIYLATMSDLAGEGSQCFEPQTVLGIDSRIDRIQSYLLTRLQQRSQNAFGSVGSWDCVHLARAQHDLTIVKEVIKSVAQASWQTLAADISKKVLKAILVKVFLQWAQIPVPAWEHGHMVVDWAKVPGPRGAPCDLSTVRELLNHPAFPELPGLLKGLQYRPLLEALDAAAACSLAPDSGLDAKAVRQKLAACIKSQKATAICELICQIRDALQELPASVLEEALVKKPAGSEEARLLDLMSYPIGAEDPTLSEVKLRRAVLEKKTFASPGDNKDMWCIGLTAMLLAVEALKRDVPLSYDAQVQIKVALCVYRAVNSCINSAFRLLERDDDAEPLGDGLAPFSPNISFGFRFFHIPVRFLDAEGYELRPAPVDLMQYAGDHELVTNVVNRVAAFLAAQGGLLTVEMCMKTARGEFYEEKSADFRKKACEQAQKHAWWACTGQELFQNMFNIFTNYESVDITIVKELPESAFPGFRSEVLLAENPFEELAQNGEEEMEEEEEFDELYGGPVQRQRQRSVRVTVSHGLDPKVARSFIRGAVRGLQEELSTGSEELSFINRVSELLADHRSCSSQSNRFRGLSRRLTGKLESTVEELASLGQEIGPGCAALIDCFSRFCMPPQQPVQLILRSSVSGEVLLTKTREEARWQNVSWLRSEAAKAKGGDITGLDIVLFYMGTKIIYDGRLWDMWTADGPAPQFGYVLNTSWRKSRMLVDAEAFKVSSPFTFTMEDVMEWTLQDLKVYLAKSLQITVDAFDVKLKHAGDGDIFWWKDVPLVYYLPENPDGSAKSVEYCVVPSRGDLISSAGYRW